MRNQLARIYRAIGEDLWPFRVAVTYGGFDPMPRLDDTQPMTPIDDEPPVDPDDTEPVQVPRKGWGGHWT